MILGDLEAYMFDGFITEEGWDYIKESNPIIVEEVLPVLQLDESLVLNCISEMTTDTDKEDYEGVVHSELSDLLTWQSSFFMNSPPMNAILKKHKVSYETLMDLVLFYFVDKVLLDNTLEWREN